MPVAALIVIGAALCLYLGWSMGHAEAQGYRGALSDLRQEHEFLRQQTAELRARGAAGGKRLQVLMLKVGLLGYEVVDVAEVPAKPATLTLRKAKD